MNVELAESDWGTVIQRRTSREPVDKGGWSIFHTWGAGTAWATPATSSTVRGLGKDGWFGWWDSPSTEQLVAEWLEAPDDAGRKRLADAINKAAMEGVGVDPAGPGIHPHDVPRVRHRRAPRRRALPLGRQAGLTVGGVRGPRRRRVQGSALPPLPLSPSARPTNP